MTGPIAGSPRAGARRTPAPFRNVFACLVHDEPECVLDLVRNLRYLDPASVILLYNGGADPGLLDRHVPFAAYDAILHPRPRPLAWGRLHDFALDCMQFAIDTFPFDAITIVDSDQLALRAGYSAVLERTLADRPGVGMLVSSPGRKSADPRRLPIHTAHRELGLWRPWLRQFAGGVARFVHWSFWPATVFTAAAARELTRRVATDPGLARILARTQIVATEEVILPTLAALLGYELVANPTSHDYIQFRAPYTPAQIASALARPDVFWAHPIPRHYDDPLRRAIRAHHGDYAKPFHPPNPPGSLARPDQRPTGIEAGWLADLARGVLDGAADPLALVVVGGEPGPAAEILGEVARSARPGGVVFAIAAPDASPADAPPWACGRFLRATPIGLLLLDGPRDYPGLARDFFQFEPQLAPGQLLVIRVDAEPTGLAAFIREVEGTGLYQIESRSGDLVAMRKVAQTQGS